MGLASQIGNDVTLSYRQERFGRIKERNTQRIEEFMRSGKLKVFSTPTRWSSKLIPSSWT